VENNTHTYTSQLDATTSLAQSYTFHNQSTTLTFGGVDFPVSSGAVKWSVNLHSATGAGFPALALTYQLSSLVGGAGKRAASNGTVTWASNTPSEKMTTYFLPMASASSTTTLSVVLEVFDVAMVDGTLVDIQHGVFAVAGSGYVLRLQFPAFTSSLHYDPSIGLALVNKPPSGGGTAKKGGDEDAGLIAGLVVGLVGGLVVVVAIIVVIVVVRKRAQSFGSDPWAHGHRPTSPRPWRTPRLAEVNEDDGL
jgi:hypothetical protein